MNTKIAHALLAMTTLTLQACGKDDVETVTAVEQTEMTFLEDLRLRAPLVLRDGSVLVGQTTNGVASFLGIPYVKKPARFAHSAIGDKNVWTGLLDASQLPAPCVQRSMGFAGQLAGSSEDCLKLNVWTPKPGTAAKLPVLVFIHGGGLSTGSTQEKYGDQHVYDGQALASRGNAVVVTIQYRLGSFGYLAPNRGVGDQVNALKWVKSYIGAFGGDESNVTIAGQSSGAESVCTLLVSPKAKGLFHRAIMQSYGCQANTVAENQRLAREHAARLGCAGTQASETSCLTAASAKTLVEGQIRGLFQENHAGFFHTEYLPVIDGEFLTEHPLASIRRGVAADIPMIVGSTADDGVGIVPLVIATEWVEPKMRLHLGTATTHKIFTELYPLSSFNGNATLQAGRIFNDAFYRCSSEAIAKLRVAHGKAPTYLYRFNETTRLKSGINLPPVHASDLLYNFGGASAIASLTPAQVSLMNGIQDSWIAFMRTGSPTGIGATVWAKATSQVETLEMDSTPRMLANDGRCAVWQQVYDRY